MSVVSKFQTIKPPCYEYVHPWTPSCSEATAGLFFHSILSSLRIYVTAYALTLLMRGKIPTKKDIKYTVCGVIQSTAFLSCHAFGCTFSLCCIRKLMGRFNFLSVAFIPSFLTSLVAILVERPSRRSLLSLYVTNVASETLFRMAVWRKWLKPVQYGEVVIFSFSCAALLYFFKGAHNEKDTIYSLLRFFVGPCEESGYRQKEEISSVAPSSSREQLRACGFNSSPLCPHSNTCLQYCLKNSAKLFSIGCGLQLCLKLLLQMNRILKNPKLFFYNLFQIDTLRLGAFFAGFGGLYRAVSCFLRHMLQRDSQLYAIPAGLSAGFAFFFFRDNTAALYVMWKTIQILYNMGVDRGYLPEFPGGTVFCYCLATATLLHASIVEPHNLRPSYWRFLMNLSGGRIGQIDRNCLDVFGCESSRSLKLAQEKILRR